VAQELAAAYFLPAGIGATLDAPILVDGTVVGVVCHEHLGGPRRFSEAEAALAVSHADMLAEKFAIAGQRDAEQRLEELASELATSRSRALAGQLAAGLAHDLANIFHVVRGNAELIAAEADPLVQAMALDIVEAAQRGSELASDLTALGRRDAKPRLVAVREHLERFAQSLERGVSPCRLLLDGRSGGRVLVDPGQLERLFMNLVLNARDAMAAGGDIRVEVADVDVGAGSGERSGPYVLVKVHDQGAGMDAATRARIFEPYFTTKATGTGLGLAIVNDLVQRAGGFIHVQSSPGAGTAMRIYLPRLA
jgi:signal transduction histidine kinase